MDQPEAGPSGIQQQKPPRSPPNPFPSPKAKRLKQSPLSANEKQVVVNIYKLVCELCNPAEYPSKVDLVKKTAETAGIAVATVYTILKQKKTEEGLKSPPPTKREPYKFKDVDEITLSGIRRKVHSFYFKNEMPTLDKVLSEVNNDDSLPNMSKSTLHKILRQKLKFKYAKRSRKSCLIDRNDLIVWRTDYLDAINQYRKEGKKIYYLDETRVNEDHTKSAVWEATTIQSSKEAHREGLSTGLKNPSGKGKRLIILHIGSTDGFVKDGDLVFEAKKNDGDYHSEMDAHNFEKWFAGLENKLGKKSVIVMDNAPYHSRRVDNVPMNKTKKADVQAWLTKNNIKFDNKEVKGRLMVKVRQNKHRFQKYAIDEMAKRMGYTVLRLPPYHCGLNPIELIWAQVKGYVATHNRDFKMATIKKLVPEAFSKVNKDSWISCINHVIKVEEKMMHLDHKIDNTVEKFVISVGSESDDTSSSDED